MRRKAPVVLKFGGAALRHPSQLEAKIRATQRTGSPVVLVVSARERVTDLLGDALQHPRSRKRHARLLDDLRRIHPELPESGRLILKRVQKLLQEVEGRYPKDRPLADRLLSQGERLAAHWLAHYLNQRQIRTRAVEADHLGLLTDNAYSASYILLDRSERIVRHKLERILARGEIPVVTGFFGRSLEGRVATLGRGGSDYSAASIGAILDAQRVELIKQTVPILSADPALVPSARPISRLSYDEAEELAQFGARVLHPLTIEPARLRGIPLVVHALGDGGPVTTIGPSGHRPGARALTLLTPLALLRIRVPGGRQRPGIVSEVSHRLAAERINLVALFTSSALLCLVLEWHHRRAGTRVLGPLVRETGALLEGPIPVSLVTAIGDGILGDVPNLPRASMGVAEGFSATPRSVSVAVAPGKGPETLRALHRALVEVRA